MLASYSGSSTHHHQSSSICITTGDSGNMSHRPAHGSNSRDSNSGQASNGRGPSDHGSNNSYPFTSLSPARSDLLSRRHSMSVQDMLNPSDEEPRRPSHFRPSPPSSDNEISQRHAQSSYHVSQTPRSARGHSARTTIGRNTQRVRRHQSRRSSPTLSSSSEAGERERRGVREQYTLEQTHFIW